MGVLPTSRTSEEHGHTAMFQLSLLLMNFPILEYFGIYSGNRDTGQLAPFSNLELGSFTELRLF